MLFRKLDFEKKVLLFRPAGGQLGLSGNVIHIPVDRDRGLGVLERTIPHTWEKTRNVFISFKRKKEYKRGFLEDNVNPSRVFEAARYLERQDLFKKHKIKFDQEWKEKVTEAPEEFAEVIMLDSTFFFGFLNIYCNHLLSAVTHLPCYNSAFVVL